MKSKKSGTQTILWWIIWISATIVSFFLAHLFWTPIIAKHFGSIRESKNAIIWVVAVFGTWMVILLPLIIIMYSKVDRAYEDARIAREKAAARFRSINVDKAKRLLPESIQKKMYGWAPTIQDGHLVTLKLKSGETVENVFVAGGEEILGIYDAREMNFSASDVTEITLVEKNQIPPFLANLWLRLDGVKFPE